MGKAKQVMDFRASKGITTSQSNEHKRVRNEKSLRYAMSLGNYDLTREHLNFEIKKGRKIQAVDKTRSIPQLIAENLASRGIKDPNEGLPEPRFRTVVNFILGGSRERMHEIAFGDQTVNLEHGADNSSIIRMKGIEEWALDMYDFFSQKYGEDNIAAFIVHLDEMNPHVHLTLLPIDANNKFAYKRMFAGKDKYDYIAKNQELHDELAKVNEKWGLGRGTNISLTGAKHRSTEEYRRHLTEECGSLEEKIENHKKALSELHVEIAIAEKRVKGLNTMIHNLSIKQSEIMNQLDILNKEYITGEGDKAAMLKHRDELTKELDEINKKLADKQEKLSEADEKLSSLKGDMENIQNRTEELKAEAKASAVSVQQRIHDEVSRAMFENVLSDIKLRLPQMSSMERSVFEDSLLVDVAERGEAIIRCAVFLFAGYIDQATTFAQTHGGGGGPGTGWGRDPKDDDREWARRCFAMAAKMMRNGSSKKMRR